MKEKGGIISQTTRPKNFLSFSTDLSRKYRQKLDLSVCIAVEFSYLLEPGCCHRVRNQTISSYMDQLNKITF